MTDTKVASEELPLEEFNDALWAAANSVARRHGLRLRKGQTTGRVLDVARELRDRGYMREFYFEGPKEKATRILTTLLEGLWVEMGFDQVDA